VKRNELRTELRKELRARRLGHDASCALCGKRNPEALRRLHRSLLEEHHLAGVASDSALTVTVCRNCHAELSESQRDHDLDLEHGRDRTALEAVEALLRGLALFVAKLAERLFEWAESLSDLIRALDSAFPEWRALPEAHQ
jgi:hypothetical protein